MKLVVWTPVMNSRSCIQAFGQLDDLGPCLFHNRPKHITLAQIAHLGDAGFVEIRFFCKGWFSTGAGTYSDWYRPNTSRADLSVAGDWPTLCNKYAKGAHDPDAKLELRVSRDGKRFLLASAIKPERIVNGSKHDRNSGRALNTEAKKDLVRKHINEHGHPGTLEQLRTQLKAIGLDVSKPWLSENGFADKPRSPKRPAKRKGSHRGECEAVNDEGPADMREYDSYTMPDS